MISHNFVTNLPQLFPFLLDYYSPMANHTLLLDKVDQKEVGEKTYTNISGEGHSFMLQYGLDSPPVGAIIRCTSRVYWPPEGSKSRRPQHTITYWELAA